ncbi:MAG: hypothetical protein B6I31_04895 [Desulfobacteraceae bacterium 4572_19]|nr:MAG: hypothetical protein B6I31_04895 [Desulfobacteraceae bacterium 4572_19]
MVHWAFEISNALIQHFSGHALWTIFGINNRLLFSIGNAAFFSFIEIFLAKTPAFVWVYPWWGSIPVFIAVYIPFFVTSMYSYDWEPKTAKRFIGLLFLINVVMLTVFAGILKWI